MTFPTTATPSTLRPTLVDGVWHTRDQRFLAGEYRPLGRGWAVDYWPTGLYTPGHTGPVRLTATDLAHAQQLIDWVVWAETEGTQHG